MTAYLAEMTPSGAQGRVEVRPTEEADDDSIGGHDGAIRFGSVAVTAMLVT